MSALSSASLSSLGDIVPSAASISTSAPAYSHPCFPDLLFVLGRDFKLKLNLAASAVLYFQYNTSSSVEPASVWVGNNEEAIVSNYALCPLEMLFLFAECIMPNSH